MKNVETKHKLLPKRGLEASVLLEMLNQAKQNDVDRSEEHTSELQSHSFISYAVFGVKKKNNNLLSLLDSALGSQFVFHLGVVILCLHGVGSLFHGRVPQHAWSYLHLPVS